MSVRLWERLEKAEGLIRDLERRVTQLEKQSKEGPKRETLTLKKAG